MNASPAYIFLTGVDFVDSVFHVHSNLGYMPLSMEIKVWLVIGGGCSQDGNELPDFFGGGA